MDLSQPASVSEFVAAGASPTDAAALAAQHEALAGRAGPDARAALAVSLENLPPPPQPAPPIQVSPVQAREILAAHNDAQLAGHMESLFAPPATPSQYQFPATRGNLTDEQFAADSALKTAFHGEGMPRFLVEGIAKSLAATTRNAARETPAQAQARIGSNTSSLQRMWGSDFDANIATVDNLLETMGARNPALREFASQVAPFLDPISIDSLLQFAKHRARGR